jgi:hypothetical protein
MTIIRGFLIVVTSGIAFAIAGGALGYGLGVFLPDYYRTVLRIPPGMELDPAQAGIGLGLTQGLIVGLVVGSIIVVTVAWYNARAFAGSWPSNEQLRALAKAHPPPQAWFEGEEPRPF